MRGLTDNSDPVGLNLTMAQKVIICDPWWNQASEDQSFCRVFRFGQIRETSLVRLVTSGTIDEDMIKMQKKKQEDVDKIM
jgi:SNF2 family DNA or RNA helicase